MYGRDEVYTWKFIHMPNLRHELSKNDYKLIWVLSWKIGSSSGTNRTLYIVTAIQRCFLTVLDMGALCVVVREVKNGGKRGILVLYRMWWWQDAGIHTKMRTKICRYCGAEFNEFDFPAQFCRMVTCGKVKCMKQRGWERTGIEPGNPDQKGSS